MSAKKSPIKKSSPSRPSRKTTTTIQGRKSTSPLGEPVRRYEMIGACDFAICDGGVPIDEKAKQALLDSARTHTAECVIQCDGYVFNLYMLSSIVLVDAAGNVTGSSRPAKTDATAPRD